MPKLTPVSSQVKLAGPADAAGSLNHGDVVCVAFTYLFLGDFMHWAIYDKESECVGSHGCEAMCVWGTYRSVCGVSQELHRLLWPVAAPVVTALPPVAALVEQRCQRNPRRHPRRHRRPTAQPQPRLLPRIARTPRGRGRRREQQRWRLGLDKCGHGHCALRAGRGANATHQRGSLKRHTTFPSPARVLRLLTRLVPCQLCVLDL